VIAAFILSARRSRRRGAAERWRTWAADAYTQARLIDALLDRDPAGSPDLHGRIAAARSAFYSLASTGPDLPSMQAASMAYSALDALDLALRPGGTPPVEDVEQLTVAQARERLYHALAVLQPLLGTGAGGAPPSL
jgi:hypothetical protein